MFRLPILSLVIPALMLLSMTCGSAVRMPAHVSEEDCGTSVTLTMGDTLEVSLRGNPTTGYIWEVDPLDRTVIQQIGEPTFTADSAARGSGGLVTVRFQAVSPGTTGLNLIYHRPFEKDTAPIKTCRVTVTVK